MPGAGSAVQHQQWNSRPEPVTLAQTRRPGTSMKRSPGSKCGPAEATAGPADNALSAPPAATTAVPLRG